jgi:Do/DeqQ family serine protease
MSGKKELSPRRFFVFNMMFVGLAAGFILAMSLYSCTTQPQPTGTPNSAAATQVSSGNGMQALRELQTSFREVAQKSLESVVKVDVVEVRTQPAPGGTTPPLFDFFFGQPDQGNNQQQFRSEGLGSGVIVRHDGNTYYVLTNAHVAGQASQIEVTLNDGRKYKGTLVGSDHRLDLAVVSFQSTEKDITVAQLGDSNTLHVGDWVIAIGSPYGLQSTVTAGIVSALHRRGGPDGNISDFIQTDASINRGNSGGPLVDLNGDVIGINTWITSQTGGSIGLGFAIPIDNVKKAVSDFISHGKVVYGWLGVQISDISDVLAADLKVKAGGGAIIRNVFQGSPAEKAGILPGDFVTSLNGKTIHNSDELNITIGNLPVGEKANFKIIRNAKPIELTATIEQRLPEDQIANLNKRLWPGLTAYPLSQDIRTQAKIADSVKGVIILTVEPQTPAAIAGLRPGDVVTEMNGTAVTSGLDFYRELNEKSKKEVVFKLIRDGQDMKVGIVRP